MPDTLDADLELLEATALRHVATLDARTSVYLSAAIDALTDPLVPPPIASTDDNGSNDPAELEEVLRAVRGRLRQLAQQAADPRRSLTAATAARELTSALDTLTSSTSSTAGTSDSGSARTRRAR